VKEDRQHGVMVEIYTDMYGLTG